METQTEARYLDQVTAHQRVRRQKIAVTNRSPFLSQRDRRNVFKFGDFAFAQRAMRNPQIERVQAQPAAPRAVDESLTDRELT